MLQTDNSRHSGSALVIIIIAAMIALLVVGGYLWYAKSQPNAQPAASNDQVSGTPADVATDKDSIKVRLAEIMAFDPATAKVNHVETVKAKGYVTAQFYAQIKSPAAVDPFNCAQSMPTSYTNNVPVITGAGQDATQIIVEKFASRTISPTYYWHKTSDATGWQVSNVVCPKPQ